MGQDLQPWKPSTGSSIEQLAKQAIAALQWSTSPLEAAKNAKKLVAAWPHARPPDPAGYATSLAAILEQYPLGVVEECCDPHRGLAREREFPPTVACIATWCDQRVKRHQGAIIWIKQEDAKRIEEQQFPDEHRKTMLQRLSKLMHNLFDPKSKGPSDDELRAYYKPQSEAAE
jgi:hypothetical protein